ncbi:MAG: response regulator [Pseudomonadales bacterium]|nr:response regulator [Pseudomonadales bacterium]
MKHVLSREEFEAAVITSPRDVVQQAETMQADLVITEIVMPELDRVALMRELKSRFDRVKVIAISGGGDPVSQRQTQCSCHKRFLRDCG